MKFVLLFFCCSLYLSGYSQSLSEADLVSRNKAEMVLGDSLIMNTVKGHDHIVFSVADKYFIVLLKKQGSFMEYHIQLDNERIKVLTDTVVQLSGELGNRIFDKTMYKKEFITFDSDFYKSGYEISSGNITYFVFKDKEGERFGESRLSMLIKPNPIDSAIYSYFVKRIMHYSKSM